MKKILLTLVTLVALRGVTFAQQEAKTADGKAVLLYENGTWEYADSIPLGFAKATRIPQLELPKTNGKEVVITHTGYALLYNEMHEQATWVAYELTREETTKLFERTNKFIPDAKVKTGTATDLDYQGSGYDRGHLAPASDMGWSATTMAESFYYSNMSPQTPGFNRGIWKRLEEQVRSWAIENEAVYVVTGPVLTPELATIGPNKVSVPAYYYKVILDYSELGIKGIGFILPNTGAKEPLTYYAVSIDSVEKLTGIDFFPLLPDDWEQFIERTRCLTCWSWNSTNTLSEKSEHKATESVQCSGVTKAGALCKNKTLNENGYCYQHQAQVNNDAVKTGTGEIKNYSSQPARGSSAAVQCSGITKAGNRCRRMTTNASGRCYQH